MSLALARFINRWVPDFRRTPHSIVARRAELAVRLAKASARHQATRDIETELQHVTHEQLYAETGLSR
jgi:uncharacterized membrane-anchored protein